MGTTIRDGATDLYRYFDAGDRLLYVGISFSAVARAAQHRQDKGWWSDFTRMTVERFDTRTEALAAELRAIRTEKPIHNVAGADKDAPAATKAPWRCEACRRAIGVTSEDGYIQVDDGDAWHCYCAKCDTNPSPRYWIDAQRIKTIEDIERWTTHLCDKRWFEQSTWVYMIRKCSIHPHASSRAFLAFDAHRDRWRRGLRDSA